MNRYHPGPEQLYGSARLRMDGDSAIDLGGGTWLGFVTYANGDEGVWLATLTDRAPTVATMGCCCPECAPHEQLGRLTTLSADHAERTKTHD
ncbi:hypothetical protein [Nocardioides sp. NPDC006303]|uniref:hypothetical protein n=1 Tax=Nocardioides sp. NPDC006303 TaxID=3156747 RepID=UPI0033AD3B69